MQIALEAAAEAGADRDAAGNHEVTPDLAYRRLAIVNVALFGRPDPSSRWVLIDAGLPGTHGQIIKAAEQRFGENASPAAIILTHGHFDHIGGLESLLQRWDVPVYAHGLEHPFLNGQQKYPPSDPANKGLMARLSPLFPRSPINIGGHLQELPADGSVPDMPGWRWLHTPGHTPGHVSFWEPVQRHLIAGDAFITTGQESAYEAMTQDLEMHGPPRYFTPDWAAAARSVRSLAALEPELAITGHGRAIRGPALRSSLHQLADNFEAIALPEHLRIAQRKSSAR